MSRKTRSKSRKSSKTKTRRTRTLPEKIQAAIRSDRYEEIIALVAPEYHAGRTDQGMALVLARAYQQQGCFPEQEEILLRILQDQPDCEEAWKRLGEMYVNTGRHAEAANALREFLKFQPDHELAKEYYLQSLTKSGQLDEAIRVMTERVEESEDPEEMRRLADCHLSKGNTTDAEFWFKRALETKPTLMAYKGLSSTYHATGQFLEARDILEDGLRAFPCESSDPSEKLVRVSALSDLAAAYSSLGHPERVMEIVEQMLAICPNDVERAKVQQYAMLYWHYLPTVTREICYTVSRQWEECFLRNRTQSTYSFCNSPDPHRPLRVGFVSSDIRTHSVSFFLESILDKRNPDQLKLYGYGNVTRPDETTRRLRMKMDGYHSIRQVSETRIRDWIREDRIDILIDLNGHTGDSRHDLFYPRSAPVQVTYLGYPDTTGLRSIDYRITDEICDPPGSEEFHSESLAYMPNGFLCYSPPAYAPPVADSPYQQNGYITFGSFNNSRKTTYLVRGLWAEVLKAVPDSRLLLKFKGGSDPELQQYFLEDFKKVGIESDRIEFLPHLSSVEHLKAYSRFDIMLDTYPYNGTTTTCESLWMGVPVVTLAGEIHASRVSKSILHRLGLDVFAATDPHEYVTKAAALAANHEARQTIRQTMRQRMQSSSLGNPALFCPEFQAILREMWHVWCRQQGAEINAPASPETVRISTPREQTSSPRPPKGTIRLVHSLLECGEKTLGTYLMGLGDMAVLERIHPEGLEYNNPLHQASEGLGLLNDIDLTKIQARGGMEFGEVMELIHDRCAEQHKTLAMLDWNHLDFIGTPFVRRTQASWALRRVLEGIGFQTRSVGLLRHPLHAWIGLWSKIPNINDMLPVSEFLQGYRNYCDALQDMPRLRFEDLFDDPDSQMRQVCEALNLEYRDDFQEWWRQRVREQRQEQGLDTAEPVPPVEPREFKPIPREFHQQFVECEEYWRLLEELGYEDISEEALLSSAEILTRQAQQA